MKFKILGLFVFGILCLALVSAGPGIKWTRESFLVDEGEKFCVKDYKAYNPWNKDSFVKVDLSLELQEVLTMQETESKEVPANTMNTEAIPIEFCFKIPKIYEKDCALFNMFLCKQECNEEQKVYEGEVVLSSVPGGIGSGSAATSSVSAPMRIKVQCNAHSREYNLIYGIVAALALIYGIILLRKKMSKKRKSKKKK